MAVVGIGQQLTEWWVLSTVGWRRRLQRQTRWPNVVAMALVVVTARRWPYEANDCLWNWSRNTTNEVRQIMVSLLVFGTLFCAVCVVLSFNYFHLNTMHWCCVEHPRVKEMDLPNSWYYRKCRIWKYVTIWESGESLKLGTTGRNKGDNNCRACSLIASAVFDTYMMRLII